MWLEVMLTDSVGLVQVAFFALCMALAGIIFYFIGVSMGWLYVRASLHPRFRHLPMSSVIHGSHPGLCSRPYRPVRHVEQGKQVGLHRWLCHWVRPRGCRMAGHNRHVE
jgi:hypothetical protein